jgi:hypothetical protein
MSMHTPAGWPAGSGRAGDLRRLLHDANDELSIALLQLELLAEGDPGTPRPDAAALREALEACARAAERIRQAWRRLEEGEDSARKPG